MNGDKNMKYSNEEKEEMLNEVKRNIKGSYLKSQTIPLPILARYINQILLTDIETSEQLYDFLCEMYLTKSYNKQLKCLKNKISERKQYLSLSVAQQKQYDYFIQKGKEEYQKSNLIGAYNYYLTGLDLTQHPIFNYYLGKILYKKGYYDYALQFLELYKKTGGQKQSKTLLYLYYIYKKRENSSKMLKYAKEIIQLNTFFAEDFEFSNIEYQKIFKKI